MKANARGPSGLEFSEASRRPMGPSAVASFDANQAQAHQKAWSKHQVIPVETPHSVGATMILIPPGEFVMVSTDEQLKAALKVATAYRAR